MVQLLKKYQDHIVFGDGFKLICIDEQYSRAYKSYFNKDAIDKFISDITSEIENRHRLLEINFNKSNFKDILKSWTFKKSWHYTRCQSKKPLSYYGEIKRLYT